MNYRGANSDRRSVHAGSRRVLAALLGVLSSAVSPIPIGRAGRAGAQEVTGPAAPVEGSVVDAASSHPIVHAEVSLVALQSTPSSLRLVRRTDTAGVYRFDGVVNGDYLVEVRALGYSPRRIVAHLEAPTPPRLAIGLQWMPHVLAPVRIERSVDGSFARNAPRATVDDVRIAAQRLRQEASLAGDAYPLTYSDVMSTVALSEADPLRALQRAPGVAARDDYTSALWTRGASGDETRVTFDGVPLFNPMHAIGAVSILNSDAVGDAIFHSSVQPVAAIGGAAGLVDVASREGAHDDAGLLGGISVLGARLGTSGATNGGRASWMLAARRSYVDLVSREIANVSGDATDYIPFVFSDVTGRFDLQLTDRWRLEASTLTASDRLRADTTRLVNDASADWGSRAARATIAWASGEWEVRQSVSASAFDATINSSPWIDSTASFKVAIDSSVNPQLEGLYRPQSVSSSIRYYSIDGSLRRRDQGSGNGATLTYRYVHERAGFATAGIWPYRQPLLTPLSVESASDYATVSASDRFEWRTALSIDWGVRAEYEFESGIVDGPRLRWAPQATVRFRPVSSVSLWAAAGVQYQHEQTIKPQAPGRDGVATDGALWMVDGHGLPPARARTLSAGAERWLGTSTLVSTSVFARNSDGLDVGDPRPGSLVDRPLFVIADGRATGVEVSARRLAGRWTGGASYTRSASSLSVGGLRYAAPTHRPDVLHANVDRALGQNWHVGAAYTDAAGAAFTRELPGAIRCDPAGCRWRIAPEAEAPSAQRGARYRSLDLSAEWTHESGRRRVTVFAQVHNAANQRNEAAYTSTEGFCTTAEVGGLPCNPIDNASGYHDKRLSALGILPLLGASIAF